MAAFDATAAPSAADTTSYSTRGRHSIQRRHSITGYPHLRAAVHCELLPITLLSFYTLFHLRHRPTTPLYFSHNIRMTSFPAQQSGGHR